MTTTEHSQHEQDRRAYLDYTRIAQSLRCESRGMHAIATQVSPDRERFGTFAEAVANALSGGYEQMGVTLALAADQAQEVADFYFTAVGAA